MPFPHLKRILMQAVSDNAGGGGGTGAPPAQPSTPPAAPATPPAASTPPAAPAPGAPPAATLTPELARAVENSVNAALRRAGVLAQNGTPPAPSAQAIAGAPTSAPAAPPQPDLWKLRELDRALAATGRAATIEPEAYRRLERDFVTEAPPDARGWVESYFRGFGVVQTAGQPAAPAPAATPAPAPTPPATQPPPAAAAPAGTQPPNTQPVSNGGGPPAPREHLEDVDLVGASEADREHLLRTKGIKWYTDTLNRQLAGKRVKVR